MHDLKVSENIIPVSEFKSNAARWLRHVSTSRETVIITQKGKAACVLLSPEAFDELTQRLRFTEAVEEGLADAENGRVSSHASVVEKMKNRFGTQADR